MKRIISLILTLCIISGFSTAFAEKDLQSEEKRGIINTDLLTDDNVLYKAMQNKKGFSFFGLNSNDDITSDFDIVLGFDMSADMYNFDYNGEMDWAENFKALSEQVPDGTRFAVVTDDAAEFTDDLESAMNSLLLTYSGKSDILDLLDNCLNSFDGTADNNVVIAVTAKVDDTDALVDKMNELWDFGIIPFVFVLDSEKNSVLDDIEYVYQCTTDLELRLAFSDLYLAFVEFSRASEIYYLSAVNNESNNNVTAYFMPNDYKENKHKFSDLSTIGEAMISVLNIYDCIPMIAYKDEINHYDLFNLKDEVAWENFLNSENSIFSKNHYGTDEVRSMIETWTEIFGDLSNKYVTNTNVNEIITQNLKRRFPVISYKMDSDNIISDITILDSIPDSYEGIYVFDTYLYLMDTIANADILYDEAEYANAGNITIITKYPSSYDIALDSKVRKEALDGKSGGIDWNISGKSMLRITAEAERRFFVSSLSTYKDGFPDIANVNKVYHTQLYTDIPSGHWAKDYIFKTSNESIIQGYTSDKGILIFAPDEYLTRCQFAVMLLRSIGKAALIGDDNANIVSEDIHWATQYMDTVKQYELFFDNDYEDPLNWDNPNIK